MRHEEYLKDLAQKLRWRRIDDDTVADILREVASEVNETGRTPEESFGTAADYAETFEPGRALSAGFVGGTVVALLATLAAAAHAASAMFGVSSPSLGGSVAIYAACLVALISAVVAGQRYDRRLPGRLRA